MDKKAHKNNKKTNKRMRWIYIAAFVAILVAVAFFITHIKSNFQEGQTTKKQTQLVDDTTKPISEVKTSTTKDGATSTTVETSSQKFIEAATIKIDNDKWQLTLLNRNYKLPNGYEPPATQKITLSEKDPRKSSEKAQKQVLDSRVAKEFQKMYDAAAKEGVYLTPYSGYRSVAFQAQIFNNYVEAYKNQGYSTDAAKYKASQTTLPPGTSEHNMGISMDIVETKNAFDHSDEFAWLMKNAQDYGFILRYPKDKTDITKIVYEPWHWRYVGFEAAKEIKSRGICLEEYLGMA